MNRSQILSNYRTEFRRNSATYRSEVTALRWVNRFLEHFSVEDSSQIRQWQVEFFISELGSEASTFEELLQARSALRFLIINVLHRSAQSNSDYQEDTPGVFKFTA